MPSLGALGLGLRRAVREAEGRHKDGLPTWHRRTPGISFPAISSAPPLVSGLRDKQRAGVQEGGGGPRGWGRRVLSCPAEPGVRAPEGPGGLLRLLQERVLPLHLPQWHHLPVPGKQPLAARLGGCPCVGHPGPAPGTGSTWGPGQCQVLGGTCP